MRFSIPAPISGGLILSYTCNAECIQCMYACSPRWNADWITRENLEAILSQLAGKIQPSLYGREYIDLSHGLHFTGGEPFLNFSLLCEAVELAESAGIPSTFVETNGFWAVDDAKAREKLRELKNRGLKGIMVSINPFYLEFIPFERTRRAVEIGYEVFGQGMIPYQLEYYRKFCSWDITGTVKFENYLEYESRENFARTAEFFLSGRSAFRIDDYLPGFFPRHSASALFNQPCIPEFIRPWHNHFDNYCSFMPGFCGGISLGDIRNLDSMLEEGIEAEEDSVLYYLFQDDFRGLFELAEGFDYRELPEGYLSKCHLCADIRRFLVDKSSFTELTPRHFYEELS